ncbi:MAG: glycosyltransferase family 2 protein [Candidatus Moranbacteria bacterium]|nr:glycosyltransferase family 2 protein [Candidatus Moranbacteria bacterium]
MLIIVNIPAYNEAKKIGAVIKSVPRNFQGAEIKVQVANDGSDDETAKVAEEAGAEFVYSFPHRGLGLTFRSGVEKALENGADIMVNIDADGQFSASDISRLIGPVIKKEADMVVASRFSKNKEHTPVSMPWIKKILNLVAAKIVGLFWGQKIDDLTCGFRAYSREVLLRLNLNHPFTYTQETIIDALSKNFKLIWVPVKVTYFERRKSRMTGKLGRFIFESTRIIVGMLCDTKPLKFFGAPAMFLITVSLVLFIIFLFSYFQDFKITPYRNWLIIGSIFMTLGIQLLVFALVADMIRSQRQISEENLYLNRKARFSKK